MPRLSIPVKVILAAGFVYGGLLLAGLWIFDHFKIAPDDRFSNFRAEDIFLAARIFFSALAAVIANHVFCDRPFHRLDRAMEKAARGDLLIRVPEDRRGLPGRMGAKFNAMLNRWNVLSKWKLEAEQDLIIAREELKYKNRLEEKNALISRANQTLENLVNDLSLLYDIGQSISQALDIDQLYTVISDVIRRHLKLENFSLMVWEENHRHLKVRAAFGFDGSTAVEGMIFRSGEGIAGEVMRLGKSIYVGDVAMDERFARREVAVEGSVISHPLKYKGEILGVVNFGRNNPHAFNEHDRKMFTLVANQMALAMANAKLYSRTKELSVRDELTGVYNRRYFSQVLQLEWKRAVRFKRELSLLMVDVDFFKRFNDTYGHLEGDRVLRELGDLLGKNLREVDTVARFGGEEFVVLLPDTDKRGALAVAEKLRHLVQEKVTGVTVSVGVASYPEDVDLMDDLIDDADIALYDAKDHGRNQVVMYRSKRREAKVKREETEKEEEAAPKTTLVH